MEFKYDVFISYRHKPLDGVITQKTFNLIEGYHLPKTLKDKGHDIQRVFRDTEELSVSRILTDTIDQALRSAKCLCIVCSTDTPSSEWVDREVAMFIELGRADHVYPLLISGTPETSFPPSLKRIPDIMDRVMDVRAPGNEVRQILRKEDTELLKIISGATGVEYPKLLREHKMRRNRRSLNRAACSVGAFLLITAVSLGLMRLAQDQRDRAQTAEAASMKILEELTYGLPDKLTGVPGAYGTISDILEENAEQINRILRLSVNPVQTEREVGANYEKLATALSVLGDYETAIARQNEAIAIYTNYSVLAEDPAPLASSYNNMGKLLSATGAYREADEMIGRGIELQRTLSEPAVLAAMLAGAEANAAQQKDIAAAEVYYRECMETLGSLDSYEARRLRAVASYDLGILKERQGAYDEALQYLYPAAAWQEELRAEVGSLENKLDYLKTVSVISQVLSNQGNYEEAERYYLQAILDAGELSAGGDHVAALSLQAELYNNCGINYNRKGEYRQAAEMTAQAVERFYAIAERTNAVPDRIRYAESCVNLGDDAFKAGSYGEAKAAFLAGIEAYASVESSLSDAMIAEYQAWKAYELLVCEKDLDGALEWALAAYDRQEQDPLVNMVLGYTCLYTGYEEDADFLLDRVAGLGTGQMEMILLDLQAQRAAGLTTPHAEELIAILTGEIGR